MSSILRIPRHYMFLTLVCFFFLDLHRKNSYSSAAIKSFSQVSLGASRTRLGWPPSSQKGSNNATVTFSSDDRITKNKNVIGQKIEQLWMRAKEKQADLVKRQSKTLEEARKEYQRRYEIPPPPGYDEWFAYAQERSSCIIDDFDELIENLRPFRGYQESQCQWEDNKERLTALLPICILGETVDYGFPSPYDKKQTVLPFMDAISEFVNVLPDTCFYINTFDEPRHVIPADKLNSLLSFQFQGYCEKHAFQTVKNTNIWSDIIASCPADSPARDSSAPVMNSTTPVESWTDATNLCSFREAPPAGIIRCPNIFSASSAARPILSAATLSTYSDIMFPTLWHWKLPSTTEGFWGQTDDMTPWNEKVDAVGWRGSSKGGMAKSGDVEWRNFQRHRMVLLANGVNAGEPYRVESTERLQSYLDIKFTSITGCEDELCEDIKQASPVAESQELSETLKNKIVLDMDGDGISGQLYVLLASDSAVMKQGIVREWHDSRLLPWLHYIPLSMSASELEPVLEYLFTDGNHVLQSIAQEGKLWAHDALRREDMRIYMYRLLLELSRRWF